MPCLPVFHCRARCVYLLSHLLLFLFAQYTSPFPFSQPARCRPLVFPVLVEIHWNSILSSDPPANRFPSSDTFSIVAVSDSMFVHPSLFRRYSCIGPAMLNTCAQNVNLVTP